MNNCIILKYVSQSAAEFPHLYIFVYNEFSGFDFSSILKVECDVHYVVSKLYVNAREVTVTIALVRMWKAVVVLRLQLAC